MQTAPSDQSSTCTPSSSGASSPVYHAHRKLNKAKRKLSRSRYLLAIKDRNRLRKLAARKIRLAANVVSPLTLLRWEEKIDRKYEKKFEEQRVKVLRLQKSNEILRANHRTYQEGCTVLENCAVMLQVKLEQQMDATTFAFSSPYDFFFPHS